MEIMKHNITKLKVFFQNILNNKQVYFEYLG